MFGRPQPSPQQTGRVLVVDDDASVRTWLQRTLQAAGFDVVVAAGGPEGLQRLREDPAIGLVLLDLKMPGMDGWGFRAEQRATPHLRDVPTVIITGEPLEHVVQGELYAAEYLLKPISRDHLISVASSYCEPALW